MAKTKITLPTIIKIENTSELSKTFIPYRENFTSVLKKGYELEFEATTSAQVLYYLKQNTEGLKISNIDAFDSDAENLIKIEVPAVITITNTSDKVQSFVPYKENFQVNVAVEDVYELEAATVGQVIYYNAQGVKNLLDVKFDKKASS